MKRYILALVAALLATAALAENVSNVQVRPRWPWNSKIDIDYTLTATSPATVSPVFTIKYIATIDGVQTVMNNVTGDGGRTAMTFNNGVHTLTWDCAEDLPADTVVSNITVSVTASDVSSKAKFIAFQIGTGRFSYQNDPPAGWSDSSKSSYIWFRRVNHGTYTLGSDTGELGRNADNETLHSVTLSKDFYISVFEITQGFEKSAGFTQPQTCGYTGSFKDYHPAENVSYEDLRGSVLGATWPEKTDYRVDATSFFGKLREKSGGAVIFDLPTDAQWEAACRAGHGTGYWNDGSLILNENVDTNLDLLGWYADNSGLTTQIVALKNYSTEYCHDMHGNVAELCLNRFVETPAQLAQEADATDPVGPASAQQTKVSVRGGSFSDDPADCRPALRTGVSPTTRQTNLGARIAIIL